jgi:hypothetical protein
MHAFRCDQTALCNTQIQLLFGMLQHFSGIAFVLKGMHGMGINACLPSLIAMPSIRGQFRYGMHLRENISVIVRRVRYGTMPEPNACSMVLVIARCRIRITLRYGIHKQISINVIAGPGISGIRVGMTACRPEMIIPWLIHRIKGRGNAMNPMAAVRMHLNSIPSMCFAQQDL